MDSVDRFAEAQLPPKEAFYNDLTKTHVSDQDYEFAQEVWRAFECRHLGDYHDVYLALDTLLLADVFENFRDSAITSYGLDPIHYCTLPGFAWDSFLKFTGVKIGLLKDPEMYKFMEEGIRGGVSVISHRYAKANNPYVTGYDETKEKSYIVDLDANNLYG